MVEFLQAVGMKVIVPQGGYFLIADWSELGKFLILKTIFFLYYLFRLCSR